MSAGMAVTPPRGVAGPLTTTKSTIRTPILWPPSSLVSCSKACPSDFPSSNLSSSRAALAGRPPSPGAWTNTGSAFETRCHTCEDRRRNTCASASGLRRNRSRNPRIVGICATCSNGLASTDCCSRQIIRTGTTTTRVSPSRRRSRRRNAQRSSMPMHAPSTASGERMGHHVVATTSEIAPGGNKVVTLEGREIVVFHVNGQFFALLNRCPRQGAPLAQAACVAHLSADEPGQFKRTRVGEMLRCAWHGWEFDLATGQSYCDPARVRVRAYPVAVEVGATLAKGPYVAETFPVTVEESYVLVDV